MKMFMSNDEIAELEYGLYCAGGSPFIKVSPVDTMNMCFRASRKGHCKAMYDIGAYYFYGTQFVEKNTACAQYMWELAASKGCNRALIALSLHSKVFEKLS
jgi:TPR repeat protein